MSLGWKLVWEITQKNSKKKGKKYWHRNKGCVRLLKLSLWGGWSYRETKPHEKAVNGPRKVNSEVQLIFWKEN